MLWNLATGLAFKPHMQVSCSMMCVPTRAQTPRWVAIIGGLTRRLTRFLLCSGDGRWVAGGARGGVLAQGTSGPEGVGGAAAQVPGRRIRRCVPSHRRGALPHRLLHAPGGAASNLQGAVQGACGKGPGRVSATTGRRRGGTRMPRGCSYDSSGCLLLSFLQSWHIVFLRRGPMEVRAFSGSGRWRHIDKPVWANQLRCCWFACYFVRACVRVGLLVHVWFFVRFQALCCQIGVSAPRRASRVTLRDLRSPPTVSPPLHALALRRRLGTQYMSSLLWGE